MTIRDVREKFEIFAKRIDEANSFIYLSAALYSASELIERDCSKNDSDITFALIRTYRRKVYVKVKASIDNGTPDSAHLEYLNRLMDQFIDRDLDDDCDFKALKEEVLSKLCDQLFVENLGKCPSKLTSTEKEKIRRLLLD